MFNVFTMALFSQISSGSQKGIRLSYVTTTLEMRRNKELLHMSGTTYSREDIFPFDTCSLFGNLSYKRPHTTEKRQCREAGRERRLQFQCL
jgi:hypothetical protein